MQNETEPKKEWQMPEVVDLDVKDSEGGKIEQITESHSASIGGAS